MTIQTSDIIFRKDLYPRFEPNQRTIESYASALDKLPPIKVNQDRILIDGFHRWKAHERAGADCVPCETITTESEAHVYRLSVETNSAHGLQLSKDEKRSFAGRMVGLIGVDEIARIVSMSPAWVKTATAAQRQSLKEERDRQIWAEHLRAWKTQADIAEVVGEPRKTVDNVIGRLGQNAKSGEMAKPFLYNIWNTDKQNAGANDHFGSFPAVFMENLLHYHTEPGDIVLDPFAGGGTTVDVCKSMARRYICSDRAVKPGREDDIIERDIAAGIIRPADHSARVRLAFLDPPYWKQAAGKYSADDADLGNMDLNDFNQSMAALFDALVAAKAEQIALVITPTQYPNGFEWVDHIFDFDAMLRPHGFRVDARYQLPYSTQQYNGNQVDSAKAERKCLSLVRDLVVWKRQ